MAFAANCTAVNAGEPADWPHYGSGPGGGNYSAASDVTIENVHKLEKVWEHNSGDFRKAVRGGDKPFSARTSSALQVTPIVIDETLYYCSPFNIVMALDAETGAEKWRYDPGVSRDEGPLVNCRGVSSWRSGKSGVCEHRIIEGTMDARVIALDAESGKPCEDWHSLAYNRRASGSHAPNSTQKAAGCHIG